MAKRKHDGPAETEHKQSAKRCKLQDSTTTSAAGAQPSEVPVTNTNSPGGQNTTTTAEEGPGPSDISGPAPNSEVGGAKVSHKVRKLAPPRPFPTVPTSVSATGPRSAHTEGKNFICITRRTELGAYLRRCKDVFLKDGYKTLHLSAMGAAIPHLMQLALSLPPILPYPPDEIVTEVRTGTVDVQDELLPEDEDEDISYRTRGKSTVSVVIKVGDGVDEPARPSANAKTGKRAKGTKKAGKGEKGGNSTAGSSEQHSERIVVRMEDVEME